ncbi:T9SS type A sorting domain-containing protein [Taibaiella chishuiensis]|uniref:Putative secreted protein (Por secretion system target) n=1 Tax=Taibaiella chishuiensis TaxID=1434707 RepID=A0A2P8CZC3_9BACT|nr:T9SS type A sorting domain-containing protein [Taibaiella chishuiensis]PSK90321.1 putative secreted protein (Por secretion system target) [Taibaiella chishuiensis]
MKKILTFCLAAILGLAQYEEAQATICYVKTGATGLNNGTSWTNAYTSLQATAANSADTIWIAAGTYKPTNDTTRSAYFDLRNKNVFGGFAGTETQLSQRNITANPTILSGDIGVAGDNSDNSYSLIRIFSTGDYFTLFADGLILEKSGRYAISFSAALTIGMTAISATFNNCIFRDNQGTEGAVLLAALSGPTRFNNCTFERNHVTGNGGVFYLSGSNFIHAYGTATATDCRFFNNTALGNGGVAYYGLGGFTADRCIFAGNSADVGGVVYTDLLWSGGTGSGPQFSTSNSIFAGNRANSIGAINCNTLQMQNCTVAGNKAGNGYAINALATSYIRNSIVWNNIDTVGNTPGAMQVSLNIQGNNAAYVRRNIIQNNTAIPGNFDFDPLFVAPAAAGTSPFNFDDYNYQLSAASPAIDLGADSFVTATMDLNKTARIQGSHVDLGCYEKTNCVSTVTGAISASADTIFCPGTSVHLSAPAGGTSYHWTTGAATDTTSVSGAGIYYVNVIDAQNCPAQFSIKITSYLPFIGITGDTSRCIPSTTLTASGNVSTYAWSNGATTAATTINTPGSYYVTGTNAQGCSVTSDTVHLFFYPTPAQPVITQSGNSVQTTIYATYQWMFEYIPGSNVFWDVPGATLQYYVPAIPTPNSGRYKVRVTNAEGCEALSEVFQYIEPLGLHDRQTLPAISLYPNPVQDMLHIDLFTTGPVSYTIHDVVGKTVATGKAQRTATNLAIKIPAQLINGIYFLQLKTEQREYLGKFVK